LGKKINSCCEKAVVSTKELATKKLAAMKFYCQQFCVCSNSSILRRYQKTAYASGSL